ncbi:MFSD5 protein, partial [Pitta sordida]|nr:MFSD5 protein [Pitta sordida]
PAFRRFQRQFQLAFLPALAADWLQGPHLFQLFQSRGFVRSQSAALYSCSFGSSLALGLCSPALLERLGRRRCCVLSSLLCSASCLLQLSRDLLALAAGRLLGGAGSSLLFSSFESWYLHQHLQRHDFPREWIPDTFARVALWNGGVAVAAGAVAEGVARGLGPVGPFVAAVPFLAFSGIFAARNWDENCG